jgi:hypothetical protein
MVEEEEAANMGTAKAESMGTITSAALVDMESVSDQPADILIATAANAASHPASSLTSVLPSHLVAASGLQQPSQKLQLYIAAVPHIDSSVFIYQENRCNNRRSNSVAAYASPTSLLPDGKEGWALLQDSASGCGT